MPNILKYLRPRFSLRTLFIAMTVCCWLSYQLVWIWRRHDALAHLHIGSYTTPTGITLNNVPFDPYSLPSQAARNVRAPWSIRLLGESGVATISVYGPDHAAIAENLRRLFPEATVDLRRNATAHEPGAIRANAEADGRDVAARGGASSSVLAAARAVKRNSTPDAALFGTPDLPAAFVVSRAWEDNVSALISLECVF